jgi:hypothetical protein
MLSLNSSVRKQDAMQLHIIYTKMGMFLSKRSYKSWRDIQDEYQNFMTSLGPWGQGEVAEYLTAEYSDLSPSAQEQITVLLSSSSEAVELSFGGQRPAV